MQFIVFIPGMKVNVGTVDYCSHNAEEYGAWETEDLQKKQQSLTGA